jgi:hypothetical protein
MVYIRINGQLQSKIKKRNPRPYHVFKRFIKYCKSKINIVFIGSASLFIIISYFISSSFLFFILIMLLSFFTRALFVKSGSPIDFTFTFFGAFVILHSMGLAYSFIFIFIAELIPVIIIEKSITPFRMINYSFMILVLIISIFPAHIGIDHIVIGLGSVILHTLLTNYTQLYLKMMTCYAFIQNITGFFFSLFYIWRFAGVILQ